MTIPRIAEIYRKTNETEITVKINLEQEGMNNINTGIAFFDHMLDQLAKHGGFTLYLKAMGDLEIDEHHTVEDSALVLGEALNRALGDKRGISRYGFLLPMDEALAHIALDLSGRPYFKFEGSFQRDQIGNFPTELVPHFFRSFCETVKATLHIKINGENTHHMIEAIFKGVGRTLRQAIQKIGQDIPSTKGGIVIAIIDKCGTNIASLQFCLTRLGKDYCLTTDKNIIHSASHVILPGVGHAKNAMKNLKEYDLIDVIKYLTQPVLGICLGMQLLGQSSAESQEACLGILPVPVLKLPMVPELTLPHMGWNQINIIKPSLAIFEGIPDNSFFYFVHNYYLPINQYTLGCTTHGETFSSITQYQNFYGVQFHPEKSGKIGERLLNNFLTLSGD